MVKAQSVATVAEIADQFRTSSAAVITEYRGLTMKQITNLRRALGTTTQYTVAKNTLVKRAAADAGVEGLDDLFTGPTAIAFIKGEPSDAAKAIREFAKTNPLLIVKGGVLEGKALAVTDVAKLADLESREVLLAKFAGAMKGNLSKAAYVFAALPSQMARLAAALLEKRAAEEPAVEEPVIDAVAEAPADAVVEAPADAVVEAPADAVVEAPADAVAEAPADAVAEAPADAVAEAPADAVAEAPADAVAEAAADSDTTEVTTTEANVEAPADSASASDAGVNTEEKQAEAASTEAPADLA